MNYQCIFKLILITMINVPLASGRDPLFQSFQNPPVEARPFVRWWWNGDCVEEEEILRQLDVMLAAGIGGVEINPIAMPPEVGIGATERACVEWGSPEWAKLVKVATDGCRERGMIADIIIGSGWPFGGEFLESGETLQAIGLNTILVVGPTVYRGNVNELMRPPFTRQQFEGASALRLEFLNLTPQNVGAIEQVMDLKEIVEVDGSFEIRVPEGNHLLFIGGWQEAFRSVMHGAPGSAGQVLDHSNGEAVQNYLDRFADSLNPVLGGKLGEAFRALFVDSIELSGANWTKDFSEIFEQRCGYAIEPYLPFVIYKNAYSGFEPEYHLEGVFVDTIQRVRYDYYKTIVDVFLENFTETYHQWCHEQGCLSRYQAYGTPWLVGMAEGYLIPDIPESNGWIYSRTNDPYGHGYWVWNKYASSAGHCMDRAIISSETMTNTQGVFRTPLGVIKEHNDMNFIMGINHDVLHGFNYSPPDAGFPGWVRYGTYFSEQNTWWPHFKMWVDYSARLSAVFQAAKPRVDVAILHPAADIWSKEGLTRGPFQTSPWYSHRLWEPLSQNGSTVDYVSEKLIQDACMRTGSMSYGPMAYKTLILSDVVTLMPETAQALVDFVDGGGRLVIVGNSPSRAPSLANASESDIQVQELMGKASGKAHRIPAPIEGKDDLLDWTVAMMESCGVEPTVKFENPCPEIYQTQYRFEDQELYFLINHSREQTFSFEAEFSTGSKFPWRWDAETGTRQPYPFSESPDLLSITLEPQQSLLLVYGPEPGDGKVFYRIPEVINSGSVKSLALESTWECEFNHVKEASFTSELDQLIDLSATEDEKLNTFSGTIVYRTRFNVETSGLTLLDLGVVHGVSAVTLNGQFLGKRWWGKHAYEVMDALKTGENYLEVEVTTTLLNYVKSLTENPTAQRWTAHQEPAPSGMMGPVTLLKR